MSHSPMSRLVGTSIALILGIFITETGFAQSTSESSESQYGYHCVHTEARDRLLRKSVPPTEEQQNKSSTQSGDETTDKNPAPSAANPNRPETQTQAHPTEDGATTKKPSSEPSQTSGEANRVSEADVTTQAATSDNSSTKSRHARKRAIHRSEPPTGRNALGVTVGMASGIGLSYRRYITNFFALRAEGGIIANTQSALYSFGVTAQEDFLRTYFHRLYALQAFGIHGGPSRILLVPGAGAGYEYNFSGMRRGVSLHGECVLSPVFVAGESGPAIFTFLPQIGVSFVF